MNLNEFVINRCKGRGRRNIGLKNNAVYGVNKIGLPLNLTAKKCSTPSDLNWGKSLISVKNTPSSAKKSASILGISSEEGDSKIIVALTEGRGEARCEVGLAAISVSKPLLILCQISDTQSYINTLTKINIFNPNEIILPNTFIDNFSGNRLIDILKKHFPNIKYTGVRRSLFNKINGLEMLSNLCIPSLNGILLILQHRFYALAAASALISHIQDALFIYYATGSIKIDYQESEGYAMIDLSTADRLELVCGAKPAQGNRFSSLFGVLNHCQTKIGTRTLRSTILRPPCNVKYIEERLECVTELVNHPESLMAVQGLLQKIANIDLLLSIGTIIPIDPQRCCSRQLNYILLLNSLIDLINPLKDVVVKFKQPFFVQMNKTLGDKGFDNIRTIIREVISETAYSAKGQVGIMERCFAIKPGINGLLDLVRKTYSERINDMRGYVKTLAEKYNLALTLGNNQTKGHHLVLTLGKQKKNMKKSDLPEEFIQVQRLAGSFTMKTAELVNFSTRLEDIMKDILSISNVMVHSLLIDVKKYTYLFYNLCEEIAHLDILQSLAETSIIHGYIRPMFGEFTEISSARHPLLDFLLPTKPISNSIDCSDDFNVHIITGPNGSGKSIFIRQVLLLQVMAQVGCYIPALSAVIKPADFLFARIYLEDNMEYGASTFVLEMKEIKYAMTTMTNNSIIIIDELCRSTSVEEGTALAMAIIEKMAESSAYVYVTTHYLLLTKLYNLYPNIKVWQMETTPIGDDLKSFKLDYRYNLSPGVTRVKNYGVYIVRNIWPDTIIKYVDEILARISKNPTDHRLGCMDEKLRLKYSIEADFRKLKSQRKLTISKINQYLNKYQSELQKLGYLINVNHLPQQKDFPLIRLQDNLSQLQHSILGEIIDTDADTNDRMQEMFTPSIHSQQSMEIECQRTQTRMMEIFTQESDQCSVNVGVSQNQCFNNSIQGPSAFSDSASYKNISNFIAENSENIYKLMPEVHIFEDIQNLNIPSVYKEPKCIIPKEHAKRNQSRPHSIDVIPNDNNPGFSNSINEPGFSLPLLENRFTTSTPLLNSNYNFLNQGGTSCTVQINNIVGDIGDIQSLKEDLEISCQFLDDDDEFEKEITTQLQDEKNNREIKASPVLYPKNSYLHYVSPVVNIVTGPDNTTLSISESDILNEMFNDKREVKECKIQVISNILLNNIIGKGQEQMYQNNINQNLSTSLQVENIIESQPNKKQIHEDSNENSGDSFESRKDLARSKQDFNLTGDEGSEISNEKVVYKYSSGSNNGITGDNIVKENTISNKGSNTSSDRDISHMNRSCTPIINLNSNHTTSSYKIELISENKFGKSTETNTRTSKSPSEYEKRNSQINASKDKASTTSISIASKLRHLDPTTSDTDNQECDITTKNADSSLTSIFSASRKRNLDQTASESTPMQKKKSDTYTEQLNESVQIFGTSKGTDAVDKAANQYISIMEQNNQNNPVYSNNNKSTEFFNRLENSIKEVNRENKSVESNKIVNNYENYKYCTEDTMDASTNNISAESVLSSEHCSSHDQENKTNEKSSSHKESDGSSSLKKRKTCKRKFAIPVIGQNRPDRNESKKNKVPSIWGNKLNKRFIPPRTLSAKEIQEDFAIQNKKLLENSNHDTANMSKYLEQLINRPTIEQIQNTTHLALIRKTDEGLQIIPAEPRRTKLKALPVRRNISSENFNMAIFSDKNAKSFDEYLKSNENDNRTFNFHFQKQSSAQSFEFYAPDEKFGGIMRNKSDESYKCEYLSQQSSFSYMTGQQFANRVAKKNDNINLTPDGYYKQNKKHITTIMDKYCNNPTQSSCNSENIENKNPSKNIFESTDDLII